MVGVGKPGALGVAPVAKRAIDATPLIADTACNASCAAGSNGSDGS